jgi:hypothetical protein
MLENNARINNLASNHFHFHLNIMVFIKMGFSLEPKP